MIRFLYGAGTAEARNALYESIQKDLANGAKAILLVPEQETVNTERRMLELLPPSCQLCFEVLNFSRLANRTFRTLGGLSYHAASPAASALLMWRTLTSLAPYLQQYRESATENPDFCDVMLDTAKQLKAYCITPDALLGAAESLPEGEPLREKLADLGTILSAYDHTLHARFDDPKDELSRLADLLSHHAKSLFANTHIYIDSFTDFTTEELTVIRHLFAAAPSVSVTFPQRSPADAGLHLAASVASHRKLLRMARELDLSVHYEAPQDERPKTALSYLSRYLFDMTAEPAPLSLCSSGEITYTVTATPFEEAKAVAAEIHRLVRAGARYRDITVVLRDATKSSGILDAALEKENIPFFLSEKADITVRPLIKLILEAFRIHRYHWREEDVIGYLKTGLCGISDDDVNLFEEYAAVWHPRGENAYVRAPFSKNPDGYGAEISARGTRILEGANRVRDALCTPLVQLFSALDAAPDIRTQCAALYDFLTALGVADALKKEAEERLLAGERREAEELSRLYEVTVTALEDIADAIGDEKGDVTLFADALKLVFSRTDIGTIPTSTDEVTVGSASMLRADHPRFVLVMGLNEGEFPRTVSDTGLFGDAEKKRLLSLGVELPGSAEELASDELFYVYRAFCAPCEGLFLYRSDFSADGHAQSPSIAIERVKTLFPALATSRFDPSDALSHIYTPEGALDYMDELSPEVASEIIALLKEKELYAAKTVTRPAIKRDASISAERAAALFDRSALSPTHIEKFASCRFAYYCEKILHLRTEASGELDYSVTGTFLHHTLEQVLTKVREQKRPFGDYSAEEQQDMVAKITAEYLDSLQAASDLSPRALSLYRRLCTLAEVIVGSLFEEFADSDFTPAFLELDLAKGGNIPTVTTADGKHIPLTGKVDRVDFWQDADGRALLRVVDYKTGTRHFSPEDLARGFSLQMPLYLMALCRTPQPALCRELGLDPGTRFTPAGVTYLSSAVGSESTDTRKDRSEALAAAAERLSREGLVLDEPSVKNALSRSGNTSLIGGKSKAITALSAAGFDEIFNTLENTVTRISGDMRGGGAAARPQSHDGKSPCDFCPFGAICRVAQKQR